MSSFDIAELPSEKAKESAEREEYLKSRGVVIEHSPSSLSHSSSSSSEASDPAYATAAAEEADRIAWLRSRGVQVELAEDRGKKIADIDPKDLVKVTLVKIPSNEKEPYSEVSVGIHKKAQGDQLLKALGPFFSSGTSSSSLNEEKILENAKQQFANQAVNITKDTLAKVSQMGGAEAFALSRPCASNNFRGVNFYLDEIGQLKSLPHNRRASDFAALCGFLNVPLAGDIYVGRVYLVSESSTFGTIVDNESFTLSDLRSDSDWIKTAFAENYERGIQTNQVTMNDEKSSLEIQHAKEREGNGGYKWSETTDNVEINYTFDKKISAKDLKVVIKPNSVSVSSKLDSSIVYFEVPDLLNGIRVDDSSWSVSAFGVTSKIDITLDKVKPQYWSKLTK